MACSSVDFPDPLSPDQGGDAHRPPRASDRHRQHDPPAPLHAPTPVARTATLRAGNRSRLRWLTRDESSSQFGHRHHPGRRRPPAATTARRADAPHDRRHLRRSSATSSRTSSATPPTSRCMMPQGADPTSSRRRPARPRPWPRPTSSSSTAPASRPASTTPSPPPSTAGVASYAFTDHAELRHPRRRPRPPHLDQPRQHRPEHRPPRHRHHRQQPASTTSDPPERGARPTSSRSGGLATTIGRSILDGIPGRPGSSSPTTRSSATSPTASTSRSSAPWSRRSPPAPSRRPPTSTSLAETIEEAGVPAIFADTSSPTDLAEALADAVGGDVEVVSPLHRVAERGRGQRRRHLPST